MIATGQAIGPFVVTRLLAQGGMGEAYLARDPRSGATVVLKLPAPELLGDVAAHARFEREAEALRRLDHPGVQRLLEAGQTGVRPYLALEFVEGESLRAILQRARRLPVDEAQRIGGALAQALAHCHARGVVHRDLKPENVLVTPDGRPVLIDFGSVLLEGARRLTYSALTGELGTPEYMAPEQVQGKRGDARTDVYALGTLVYELIAGRPPFAGQPGEGAVQIMRRHLQQSPPPLPAGIGAALQGVIRRALRRDADRRFQTMAAFGAALADPARAVAAGAAEPGWPAEDVAMVWTAPLDEPQSLRDWLRYVAVALAALLALVAIGVAVAWLRPS